MKYTFEEFKAWFEELDDNHVFSFGNENSKNECGCLLTQFFRSKNIEFDCVTFSSAIHKGKVVASIGEEEPRSRVVEDVISSFLELDISRGWDNSCTVKKENIKPIFKI